MDLIFHEKQEGQLCAQHCLNALLQGPYFTAVDLATLAQRMDDEERAFMAESGMDTEEYRTFIQQPSGNMDDSGFFSVQVISSALEVWSLELIPLTSPDDIAVAARNKPEDQTAYICNYREHWFTIRKLGNQWFNLNSLLSGPELISTLYLSIFLEQLKHDNYSIFVVRGNLPPCPADDALKIRPAVAPTKVRPSPRPPTSPNDPDLEKAIRLSIAQEDEEDTGLARALQKSLENNIPCDDSLEEAIQLSLTALPEPPVPVSTLPRPSSNATGNDLEEREMLDEAIRLSLQGHEDPRSSDKTDTDPKSQPKSQLHPPVAANLRSRSSKLDSASTQISNHGTCVVPLLAMQIERDGYLGGGFGDLMFRNTLVEALPTDSAQILPMVE